MKEFRVYFDEESGAWKADSEDLQQTGHFSEDALIDGYKDLAPAMALMDAIGYDSAVIADTLGLLVEGH